MKNALRILAVVIAIVVSAPAVLMALYGSLVALFRLPWDSSMNESLWTLFRWPVILLLWWVGLIGALWLCVLLSRRETSRIQTRSALAMLGIGIIGLVMLEFEGAKAPALRFYPIGLEAVPYLSLLALGAVLGMTSKTFVRADRDAQEHGGPAG